MGLQGARLSSSYGVCHPNQYASHPGQVEEEWREQGLQERNGHQGREVVPVEESRKQSVPHAQ